MKDSKNQGTQGWKRKRETEKRGYNTKGYEERGIEKISPIKKGNRY
jgi:hypothetical protein